MLHTDSFIVYIKKEDICVDIIKGNETRFDTLNYELNTPLPREKNKRVIGLTKNEPCRK